SYIDLVRAGFIGGVRQPFPVGRKDGVAFDCRRTQKQLRCAHLRMIAVSALDRRCPDIAVHGRTEFFECQMRAAKRSCGLNILALYQLPGSAGAVGANPPYPEAHSRMKKEVLTAGAPNRFFIRAAECEPRHC